MCSGLHGAWVERVPQGGKWSINKQAACHRYPARTAAATDVFDYIEMFYHPIRRHGFAGDLSPVEFERRYAQSGS
jgi:transposase InsO family protein